MTAACCAPLSAQSSGHLKVGEPPKVAGKRGAAVQAKIPLAVDPGFHVNSNTPSDEYLIPLKLTWKSTGALEGGQVIYPKPSFRKNTSFSEKPLSVFTGKFRRDGELQSRRERPRRPRRGGRVSCAIRPATTKPASRPKTVEITFRTSVQ